MNTFDISYVFSTVVLIQEATTDGLCACGVECVRECERGKEAEWEKLLSGEISRHVCAENQIQSQEPFVGYLLCPQGLCGTRPSILPFGSLCNSFKWKNYVAHFTDEETEAH